MSSGTALRPRAEANARWRGWWRHDGLAIAAAALIAFTLTQVLVDEPHRVTMTIVNDTPYDLTIDVSEADDPSWTPLIVIDARQTRVRAVIDQGQQWAVRFAGQGHSGGQLTVSRDQLVQADWQLVVPADVADTLERSGATPPPSRG